MAYQTRSITRRVSRCRLTGNNVLRDIVEVCRFHNAHRHEYHQKHPCEPNSIFSSDQHYYNNSGKDSNSNQKQDYISFYFLLIVSFS